MPDLLHNPGMPYAKGPEDATLFFHATRPEIQKMGEALQARGIPSSAPPDVLFPAMIEELDKIVPSAGLAKRFETETIGIAVTETSDMPDSRYTNPSVESEYNFNPPAVPAGEPARPHMRGGIDGRTLHPSSPMARKIAALEMQPYSPEEVAAMQAKAGDGAHYPTHHGVLKLDGKGEIAVYQLQDGRRIIDAQDLMAFLSTFGGV